MTPSLVRRAAMHAVRRSGTAGHHRRAARHRSLAEGTRPTPRVAHQPAGTSPRSARNCRSGDAVRLVRRSTTQVRAARPSGTRRSGVLHPCRGAPRPMVFLCSHNSARSHLAAALWTACTGERAASAGTHPAPCCALAPRPWPAVGGLDLGAAVPRLVGPIDAGTQVVTVCDRAHEELHANRRLVALVGTRPRAPAGTAAAFDAVVATLDRRIDSIIHSLEQDGPRS